MPTNTDTRTPLHTALDRILELTDEAPLSAHVIECREAGMGWDRTAQEISRLIGTPVSGSALSGWFPKL